MLFQLHFSTLSSAMAHFVFYWRSLAPSNLQILCTHFWPGHSLARGGTIVSFLGTTTSTSSSIRTTGVPSCASLETAHPAPRSSRWSRILCKRATRCQTLCFYCATAPFSRWTCSWAWIRVRRFEYGSISDGQTFCHLLDVRSVVIGSTLLKTQRPCFKQFLALVSSQNANPRYIRVQYCRSFTFCNELGSTMLWTFEWSSFTKYEY